MRQLEVEPDGHDRGVEDLSGVDHSGHTTPAHSAEPLSWVALDNGYTYSCGLLSDGRLECWGNESLTAVAVPRDGLVQFDLASWSGCGLDAEGRVDCWCGGEDEPFTCVGEPAGGGFVRVLNGDYVACAEDAAHHLQCWGHGPLTRPPEGPVDHWDLEWHGGCAIVQGEIVCWGTPERGWSLADEAEPGPPTGGGFVEVALGRNHGCALDKTGEVQCWGSTSLQQRFPEAPPGPFVHLESYSQFTCGFRSAGEVDCWYYLPDILDTWSWPRNETWAQFGLGDWDACGLTVDGRALCFPAEYESYGEQQVPDLAEL